MVGDRLRAGALLAVGALFLVPGCTPAPSPPPPVPGAAGEPGPLLRAELDPAARRWVEETLSSLTLEEAVGQLVMPWIPGSYVSTSSPEFLELAEDVEGWGVGGVAISIGLPLSYAAKLNALQARARVPLLVASDFENGGPGMRINHVYALPSLLPQGGGTSFPPTMALGAVGSEEIVEEVARITAVEARAVGVHLNFAPVLDVNSNPENPIINTRSFGEDPRTVARLGRAYLRGARRGGVLTTAKHFPGHGDTRTDSHVELPVVPADRARLDSLELVPFRAAVEEGVDAVMTAHVAVPGILGPGGPPATLSRYFLTGLLREEMAFRGLLLTDALRMGAITARYGGGEAAVLALEAGADVLLAPEDVGETVEAVVDAVRTGRLSEARVRASVRRILEAKARVGLHRRRFVDLEAVDGIVGAGPHLAFADSVASLSITLPRDRDGLVPLDPAGVERILSVTFARPRDLVAGRAFDALLREYVPRVRSVRLTTASAAGAYDSLRAALGGVDLVVVGAYVPPRAGAGSVDLPEALSRFLAASAEARPTILVSFGSPYLLSAAPEVGTYLLAWGPREVSQRAAARALVGERGITGRLPVSLPPFHRRGEGLRREARPSVVRAGRAADVLVEAGFVPGRGETGGAALREAALRACRERGELRPWAATCEGVGGVVVGPEADPAAVDMSARALARVDSLLLAGIADSVSPGAALAVGRHGRLVRLRGYGRLDWGEDAPPATPSSLWDLASLTKVVGTTTAAMILVEEGRLDLDAPVVRYLPWWDEGDPAKALVTVRQLLLHRAGLPPFRRFFREIEGEEAYRRAVGELELEYPPGDSTVYSDIGLMTLGFVVEGVTGRSLDAFLRERVWEPLGMQDTGFNPPPELLGRIAPTEVDTVYRHRKVHGVVHDENAYAMGGVAGHAGLFSSARDLAVFAEALLEGGSAPPCPSPARESVPCSAPRSREVRLVKPSTVEAFTRRWDGSATRALGWDTPGPDSSAGTCLSPRAFGHTGFTGTSIWVDPELDLFVVLLTSRVNPTRTNTRHVPLRRALHDAVVRAVRDRPGGACSGGNP